MPSLLKSLSVATLAIVAAEQATLAIVAAEQATPSRRDDEAACLADGTCGAEPVKKEGRYCACYQLYDHEQKCYHAYEFVGWPDVSCQIRFHDAGCDDALNVCLKVVEAESQQFVDRDYTLEVEALCRKRVGPAALADCMVRTCADTPNHYRLAPKHKCAEPAQYYFTNDGTIAGYLTPSERRAAKRALEAAKRALEETRKQNTAEWWRSCWRSCVNLHVILNVLVVLALYVRVLVKLHGEASDPDTPSALPLYRFRAYAAYLLYLLILAYAQHSTYVIVLRA